VRSSFLFSSFLLEVVIGEKAVLDGLVVEGGWKAMEMSANWVWW
jgi:hypothetical protein